MKAEETPESGRNARGSESTLTDWLVQIETARQKANLLSEEPPNYDHMIQEHRDSISGAYLIIRAARKSDK